MTSAAPERQAVRVGDLVRAPSDRQHTERGRIVEISELAPVALVRFICGCVAFVPTRRLIPDPLEAPPRCERSGCTNPRWEGPYCPGHRDTRPASGPARTREPSFDSDQRGTACVVPAPSALSGVLATIDDQGSETNDRAAAVPPTPPPALRVTRAPSPAVRTGAGGAGRRAPAPDRGASPEPAFRWTPELIVVAMRAWRREHGEPPRMRDWLRPGPDHAWPTCGTVIYHHGSWGAALTAAGMVAPVGRPREWTRERIVAALRAHHEATGEAPRFDDWMRAGSDRPCSSQIARIFGTWSAAIAAAGLTPHRRGRPRREPSTPASR